MKAPKAIDVMKSTALALLAGWLFHVANTNFIDFKAAFWFTFAWMVVGDVDPLPESYQSLLPVVRFVVACATVAVIAPT
ncbi:hypothetical protein HCU74_04800 [Spongiibacter sp. KMU-166]|uniref:Uncharacterized protein n=1 Tax=Spongiibacter thalassae TaxID=2721624 RepID=A0ABX1GC71_9GAMM|nr:hypothetical protein [Spongiibacter thalassae]NKI16738.1 hypothetical protein [Spongiibacter thalassae]